VTNLVRSYLLGRSMGDVVTREREEVVSMLVTQGLISAAMATRNQRSYTDFIKIRSDILAGGAVLVRTKGGKNLSGPIRMPAKPNGQG
jgi:hypothetical protein